MRSLITKYQIQWALNLAEEFQRMKCSLAKTQAHNMIQSLRKRINDLSNGVLVFIDASFNWTNGKKRGGVVIMNCHGKIVETTSMELGVMDSPLEAELKAVAEGIKSARMKGYCNILMLTDC